MSDNEIPKDREIQTRIINPRPETLRIKRTMTLTADALDLSKSETDIIESMVKKIDEGIEADKKEDQETNRQLWADGGTINRNWQPHPDCADNMLYATRNNKGSFPVEPNTIKEDKA